jgi:hypothetical protein
MMRTGKLVQFLSGAAAGVALTIAGGAWASHGSVSIVVDRDTLTADVGALNDQVDAIDRLNARSTDARTRKQVSRKIAELRGGIDTIADEVRRADPVDRHGHDRDHDRDRDTQARAISDADFTQLLADVDAAAQSSDKLMIVTQSAELNYFTSAQVGQIVDHLSFSEDKVNAAAALYPRTIDPSRFTTVYSHFTMSSDKEELRKRITH